MSGEGGLPEKARDGMGRQREARREPQGGGLGGREREQTTYDAVEDILHTTLAEELRARPEGDLDDASELGELLCRVCLNVGDACAAQRGKRHRFTEEGR